MLHQLYMPVSAGCRQRKLSVKTGGQQFVQLAAFLVAEARAPRLGPGFFRSMSSCATFEIAAEDDRFNGVQLL